MDVVDFSGFAFRAGNRSIKVDIITKVQLKTAFEFCTSARLMPKPIVGCSLFIQACFCIRYIIQD